MANKLEKKKYHFIYKTTNLINNKYYIGMHSTTNLKDGYLGSGKFLRSSLRKHGKENFKCEILEWCLDREKLIEREKQIITEVSIKEILCMNLKPGGKGGFSTKDQIKGSPAGVLALKKKMKEDKEFRDRHSKRTSLQLKKDYESGKRKRKPVKDWTGLKHKQETIEKIRKSKAGQGWKESNSQYGTCWITREGINKKIKKEEVEQYINLGWNKGRKLKE